MEYISYKINSENGGIESVVFLNKEGGRKVLDFNSKNKKEIKKFFENRGVVKCGHDIKKDIKILRAFGINFRPPTFDTMIASYLLYPGKRNYEIKEPVETLEKDLKSAGLIKLFDEVEMPLIFVLEKMENNGIKINARYLKNLSLDFSKKINEITEKIYSLAGEKFNINSPAQLKTIIFEKLKISARGVRKTSKKGALSTAARELERLKDAHPIINLLTDYRELAKLKSTYIDALPKMIDKKTKRIHTTFNQAITATGRLSSSEPNLQNIPIRGEYGKEIRKAFIAEKNHLILSLDYSQIELRVIASISGDKNMTEAFMSGEDIHTRTAAEIAGIPANEVTKEMRRAAKAINFGIIYGMGSRSLAESAGLSLLNANDFIARYFALHGEIKNYLEEEKALAHSLGYTETLFGRRRYFPEITSWNPCERAAAERMAINHPIQGTAADIIKIAMIKIDEKITNAKMIMQVHDELVFEIPKKDSKKTAEKIKDIMENAVKLNVPVLAETHIGETWEK